MDKRFTKMYAEGTNKLETRYFPADIAADQALANARGLGRHQQGQHKLDRHPTNAPAKPFVLIVVVE
ncbi:MAG: hypothetical protein U5M51_13980 [Emticicia sp.]|nr:hypothetical protein [Emticicia sp.]